LNIYRYMGNKNVNIISEGHIEINVESLSIIVLPFYLVKWMLFHVR
jgi:hypothetical protein